MPGTLPALGSSPHATKIARLAGHRDRVAALAWSSDGNWLLSGSSGGELKSWNTFDGDVEPASQYPQSDRSYTSASWQPGGRRVACGSEGGGVEILDVRTDTLSHPPVQGDSRCVAWAPQTGWLAFGGEDLRVNFCRDIMKGRDVEVGVGHVHPISSMTWSPDGEILVSGTKGGTIGLWPVQAIDNQLRNALVAPNSACAHEGPVLSLAFCAATSLLASVSTDCHVRLWNIETHRMVDVLDLGETVLDAAFSADGEMLVVQTLRKLTFLRCRPLTELFSYAYPAAQAMRASMALHPQSARLATVDRGDHSIAVWQIDFAGMLQAAAITRRHYSNASVALLGDGSTGRTNLALALTGKPFAAELQQHRFEVHRLRLAPEVARPDEILTREIAFWDLPSDDSGSSVEHALVQRLHAGDRAVKAIVLDPTPGSEARDNLVKWKSTLRRYWPVLVEGAPPPLALVARCDLLRRQPTASEVTKLSEALGVERLWFVSVVEGWGVGELVKAISSAVDWTRVGTFSPAEIFSLMQKFILVEREGKRHLTTVQAFHDAFTRANLALRPLLPPEDEVRIGVGFLETLGEVECFEVGDELLLSPEYFHSYALAMIRAAGRDPMGLGRLPLDEARRGFGEQFRIPQPERLRPLQAEQRLLRATIDELKRKGVAEEVSTFEMSYLVFPGSATTVWSGAPPREQRAMSCQLRGAVEDAFTSLRVRLLGLGGFFAGSQVWKNAAKFDLPSGGACGLVLDTSVSGDVYDLGAFFVDHVDKNTRDWFCDTVRGHVRQRFPDARFEETAVPKTTPDPGGATDVTPIEIFFCHRLQGPSRVNVEQIAKRLQKVGIRPWLEEFEVEGGETGHKRLAQLEKSQLAAVFFDGPFDARLRNDCATLVRRRCEIVPVILQGAPPNFVLPDDLGGRFPVDFRLLDPDPFERLERAIRRMATIARVRPSADGGSKHVFISYCGDDWSRVSALRQALVEGDHQVWWDEDIPPGGDWRTHVRRAIEEAYAVVVCLSKNVEARASTVLYSEIQHAIEIYSTLPPGRAFLFVLRLDPCEVPKIPLGGGRMLDSLQYHDCFDADVGVRAVAPLLEALKDARRAAVGGHVVREEGQGSGASSPRE